MYNRTTTKESLDVCVICDLLAVDSISISDVKNRWRIAEKKAGRRIWSPKRAFQHNRFESIKREKMTDVNVVNHYANPSFNAEQEALGYFSRETVDQYKGYSRQIEQMKVG